MSPRAGADNARHTAHAVPTSWEGFIPTMRPLMPSLRKSCRRLSCSARTRSLTSVIGAPSGTREQLVGKPAVRRSWVRSAGHRLGNGKWPPILMSGRVGIAGNSNRFGCNVAKDNLTPAEFVARIEQRDAASQPATGRSAAVCGASPTMHHRPQGASEGSAEGGALKLAVARRNRAGQPYAAPGGAAAGERRQREAALRYSRAT
jgi:hypothetical protein